MTSLSSIESSLYSIGPLGRLMHWLDAMPHPSFVCEIAPTHVAAAAWGSSAGHLEGYAAEPLPEGAVWPSPIEPNIPNPEIVSSALRRALARVPGHGPEVALLIPDPVVRVFILPFETLPRRAQEAVPLLRWRLKKSVPFDLEEAVVSYMRQRGRGGGLEVVAALARQQIVREYETIVEAAGMTAGVMMSSGLATLSLLSGKGSTLLARFSGRTLTTVIVHEGDLCVYRSTEMPVDASLLEPQAMLDEIFPAVAYYQDTWGSGVERFSLTGFGNREEAFRQAVRAELKCNFSSLGGDASGEDLPKQVQPLMDHNLEALIGWAMNQGA